MATTLFYPYTSLAAVQQETKNRDSDKEDWFKECINNASRIIEEELRRDFRFHDHTSSALTVKSSWFAGQEIFLPWPILTLTEVKINEDDALSSDDYIYENGALNKGNAVIRRRGAGWGSDADVIIIGGSLFDSEEYGSLDRPTKAYPDRTLTKVYLKGTFGYALVSSSTAVTPVDIPEKVKRAATLTAAAISGYMRKEIMGMDGERQSLMDTRIPPAAWALIKNLKVTVL